MSNILFADYGRAISQAENVLNSRAQRNALAEDKAREEADAPHISAALKGDRTAIDRVSPNTAMKLAPLFERMDAAQRTRAKDAAEFTASAANAILQADPAERPGIYQTLLADGKARGFDLSKLPPQYSPQLEPQLRTYRSMAIPMLEHFKNSGEGVQFAPPAGGGATPASSGPRATAPTEWEPHFAAASAQYGVPVPLIKAVAGEESAFNSGAVSPAGAGGVMQIMPGTAKDLGVTNRFDAGQSINKGTAYLKQQMDKFGNLDHALVAYNWGPGNAEKWIAAGANPAALPAETRNYITKVKSNLQGQIAQAGPGVPQGDNPPAADGSGTPLPPQGAPAVQALRGLQLPPGARVALQKGVPIVKDGAVLYIDAQGGWGAAPLPKSAAPKEQGVGPFAGTGMDAQMLNILHSREPGTQEYAVAHAWLGRARTTVDDQGRPVTIQPMNLSMYPAPTFGQGGQPSAPAAPQGVAPPPGAAPPAATPGASTAPLPGGGQVTVGAPLAPKGPSATEMAKLRDARAEGQTIINALEEFRTAFKGASLGDRAKSVTGATTPLNTSFNKAALLAKGEALFNLGVLNGPDLDIIRRTLPDPATIGSAVVSSADADNSINQVIGLINDRIAQKEKQLGISSPGALLDAYNGPDGKQITRQEIEATAKNRNITPQQVIEALKLQPVGPK